MRLIELVLLDMAAVALILLCGVVAGGAVLGALWGAGPSGGGALARDLMVAVVALPLAAATAGRAHLAVGILSDRLGPKGRARLVLLGHLAGLLATLPLILATWQRLSRVSQPGDTSQALQLWPLLLLVGLAAMWLRLAVMLVADLRAFRAAGMITDEHGQEAF